MTTTKFKIGDKVRIKGGLTETSGIEQVFLDHIYENNVNTVTEILTTGGGISLYDVTNDSMEECTFIYEEEQLELISPAKQEKDEIVSLIEEKIQEALNKPYNVKVKYHDSEMPKFEQIDKGNWIDCRVIKGGKITHSDGTKEPLEWKQDKDGTYYIEYKQGDFMMLPLGFSLNQGKGYEVNLVPRSSTFKNYGIIQTNHFGVGDDTFVGNNDMYHFPCYALRDGRINLYDRVCQMKINKAMPQVIFNEVEDMESEDRGGFGSTGVE